MQIIEIAKNKEYVMKVFQVLFFGLLMGFLFFFISHIKSPYDFHTKVTTTLYDEIDNKDDIIIIRGTNVKEDIDKMAKFVYADIFNWLPILPSGKYSFISDGVRWIFVSNSEMSGQHISDLHEIFASKFPKGIVRSREMPNGEIVEDIVEDEQGVSKKSEKIRGFDVIISKHFDTSEAFITAQKENIFLFGNDISLSRRAIYAF